MQMPGRIAARAGIATVVAAVLVGGMLADPGIAAASAWSIVPSPSPPARPRGGFSDVACTAATTCFAVGGSGSTASVARWNGASWSLVATPTPPGSSQFGLNGLSCPGAYSCFAVGTAFVGSGATPLFEHWNGIGWSVQSSPPLPTGATVNLASVACVSPTNCFAAGTEISGSLRTTFVEHWNGSTWSIASMPNPSGATDSELQDIACLSATSCDAVGFTNSGTNDITLVEHWNGSTWSIAPSPSVSGAVRSELLGVRCSSASSCFAVGFSQGSADFGFVLIERWDGSTWSIAPSPSTGGDLSRVACTSDANCIAVGQSHNGAEAALVEQWNGSGWSIMPTPDLGASAAAGFGGVHCLSPTRCFAVGFSTNGALIEELNGTTWSLAPPPAGASDARLLGVACTSTTSCFAVGESITVNSTQTLAERLAGTTWTILPSPSPAGATRSALSSVACSSATSCFAVGSFDRNPGTHALIERWNGSMWTIPTSPSVAGELNGISCPGPSNCFAVGFSSGSSHSALVEHWNGTAWSVVSTPSNGAAQLGLNSVSCWSGTSCFAVGFAFFTTSPTVTLTERWNGTTWTIVGSANPANSTFATLAGVSCVNQVFCFAVGNYETSTSPAVTLVERWNGSNWVRTSAPNPVAAINELDDVSCAGKTSCYIVGATSPTGGNRTLIEHWDGTSVTLVPSPNAPGATDSGLRGVACRTTVNCWAVGEAFDATNQATLVEHRS
jgi:hypothetical protein